VPNQKESVVEPLDLNDLIGDAGDDIESDPQEARRDRNAHLLLTAWRMVMEAEAKAKAKP